MKRYQAIFLTTVMATVVYYEYSLNDKVNNIHETVVETNEIVENIQRTIHNTPYSLDNDYHCLASNIYWESRNQSLGGKLAVGQVVLNRVDNKRFPDTICKVVYEGPHYASGHPKRNRCQFSWYCDGKIDTPNESPSWRVSQKVAEYVIRTPSLLDITDGATHYHADYIDPPRWAKADEKTVQIDTHLFYNKKNSLNF